MKTILYNNLPIPRYGRESLNHEHDVDSSSADSAAMTYNIIGLSYVAMGHLEESVKVYEEALVRCKSHYVLENNLSIQLRSLHRYDESLRVIERAIVRDPENAILRSNAGYIAEQKQDWTLAQDYYEQALEIDPAHPQIQMNIVNLRQRLGNTTTNE